MVEAGAFNNYRSKVEQNRRTEHQGRGSMGAQG